MTDQPRRRMSRDISLVLLTALPGVAGCDGGPADDLEEVEVLEEVAAPEGPAHLIGGPFVGWWGMAHPPVVGRRMVARATTTGTTRGSPYRTYPRGRSGYLSAAAGSSARPASSASVTRGGFGSTGHSAAGG